MKMQGPTSHLLQGLAAAGTILAAEAAHAIEDIGDWVSLIERLGLAIALVTFFVWTGWKREQRMAKRFDQLEKDKNKLSEKVAELGEQVTQALNRELTTAEMMAKALDSRTCFAFRNREEFDEFRDWRAAKSKADK